jgi:hypothetical protein
LKAALINLMAKQTTVTFTDDTDGSTNAKEVSFSPNGNVGVRPQREEQCRLGEGAQAVHCQGNRAKPAESAWHGCSLLLFSIKVAYGLCHSASMGEEQGS